MNLLANRLWARRIVNDVLAEHVEDGCPHAFAVLKERDRDRAVGIIFDQIMADLDALERVDARDETSTDARPNEHADVEP